MRASLALSDQHSELAALLGKATWPRAVVDTELELVSQGPSQSLASLSERTGNL